jgi:hypothetical protein
MPLDKNKPVDHPRLVHRHKKPSHLVGLEGDDAVVAVGSDGAIGAVFDAGVGQKGFEQGHRSAGHFGVIDAFPKPLLFELLDGAGRCAFASLRTQRRRR